MVVSFRRYCEEMLVVFWGRGGELGARGGCVKEKFDFYYVYFSFICIFISRKYIRLLFGKLIDS